jgi:hypothetical protein
MTQDEADPQFPQSVASAACALWTAAAAGDGAGLCRTLRRDGAASLDIGDPADAGATALMKAARAGALESVMQLLRAGADTEAQNSGGETAMHAAAGTGQVEIIDALVAAGAALNFYFIFAFVGAEVHAGDAGAAPGQAEDAALVAMPDLPWSLDSASCGSASAGLVGSAAAIPQTSLPRLCPSP